MNRLALTMMWCTSIGCSLVVSTEGLGDPVDLTSDASASTADDAGSLGPDPDDDASEDDDMPEGDGGSTLRPDAASGNDAGPTLPADDASMPSADRATVLYEELAMPSGVALREGQVCWVRATTPHGLFCGARDGQSKVVPISHEADLALLEGAFDLAFDAGHVYWSNGKNNQLVRRKLSGGPARVYFNGGQHISYIAARGHLVFATSYQEPGDPSGYVIFGPREDSQDSTLIYPGEPGAAGIAVLGGMVYWGTSKPDQLAFGSVSGNANVTRIDASGAVTGVAVDDEGWAYFIADSQSIYRVAPGAVSPELVYQADQAFGTSDIALDDAWVYWSERDRGRILRMPR
jgi:hypothetical protein